MAAYYNEIDPFAAKWLRNLIAAGHIAAGDVDERSIEDVKPDDLAGYTQCHFFAGIGVWSRALRNVGWPDDRAVWTGSCPCQPFSAAVQGNGFADERHLWPSFFHLISVCLPPKIYGEQVASDDGLKWLDLVQADLEATGYAVGAADLCAAGIGAPHIRQRLWWVADAMHHGLQGGVSGRKNQERQAIHGQAGRLRSAGGLAYPDGIKRSPGRGGHFGEAGAVVKDGANADGRCGIDGAAAAPAGPVTGFWAGADWLHCRDEKWRPVEPGTFPLAHGATARVGRLRAYGNAINAEVARIFIEATA